LHVLWHYWFTLALSKNVAFRHCMW